MNQIDQINHRIKELDTEIETGRWAVSGKLELWAALAQLEIAKALCRIADQMEKPDGNP